MVNYKIDAPHFDACRYSGSHNSNGIITPSKAMQHILNTESSWPRNLSMPPAPHLFKSEHGDVYITKTSNNLFVTTAEDFEKYGSFSQIDDFGFKSWKETGEKTQTREYVVLPQKSVQYGLIESFGERKLKLTKGDTPVELYVHDTWYTGRINDYGRKSHLAGTLKQHLMEYYGFKSTQELVDFFDSKGMGLEDLGYVAIGFIPGIYGIGRANDGKVIFFAAEDSHDIIAEEASRRGLKTKLIRDMAFDEEESHNARRSYDKIHSLSGLINEEIATKRMLQDFYIKQAKGAQGNPELVKEYLTKDRLMEEDIKTTRSRYTKAWRRHWRELEGAGYETESENPESNLETIVAGKIADYAPDTKAREGKLVKISEYIARKGKKSEGNKYDKSRYTEDSKNEKIREEPAKNDAPRKEVEAPEADSEAPAEAA